MDRIGAFSTEHAARLVGLTTQQLVDWDRTGIFSPGLVPEDGRRRFGRIYTFPDIVILCALARVHDRLSVEQLRELAVWLDQRREQPAASTRFSVVGDRVVYHDTLAATQESVDSDAVLVALEDVENELETAFDALEQRDPTDIGRITRNRRVLGGDWVIAGTRIPVWMIHDLWQTEHGVDAIIQEFPMLTPADIEAALAFEVRQLPPAATI